MKKITIISGRILNKIWCYRINFLFLFLIYFCFLLYIISTKWLSLIILVNSLTDYQSTLRLKLDKLCYCLDYDCIVYIFYYFLLDFIKVELRLIVISSIYSQ